MLIDALVTDQGDAILRQTPADLIGTPLLLRQFFFDQLHQIWRHFARLVRGLLASLRGLLVRLLEAIAARAGVANKLAADRRRIDANLPRDVGLRVAALQERVNLAALFAGQILPIRLLPTPPTCRVLPGSGVKLCVGRCGDVARDAEQGTEGVELPPVEAELSGVSRRHLRQRKTPGRFAKRNGSPAA